MIQDEPGGERYWPERIRIRKNGVGDGLQVIQAQPIGPIKVSLIGTFDYFTTPVQWAFTV
jgi:hypothetical protein